MSMKYKLETTKAFGGKRTLRAGIKRLMPLIVPERGYLAVAVAAMLLSSGATLVGPVIIGRAVDTYVRLKDSRGLLLSSVLLLAVYLIGVIASYTQIRTMGGVGTHCSITGPTQTSSLPARSKLPTTRLIVQFSTLSIYSLRENSKR